MACIKEEGIEDICDFPRAPFEGSTIYKNIKTTR